MARRNAENPSDSKNQLSTVKKLVLGTTALGMGVGSILGLTGCGDKVSAEPKPEQTPTATAPQTPVATESATPAPTPSAQEVSPTPEKTEVIVTPFREWNIESDTGERLQSAQTNSEKWGIIKKVIQDNNEEGSYELDTSMHTRSVEGMFNRAAIELATMTDIGQDPNAQDGDIISTTWAELAIIDDDFRNMFINITSSMRMSLATSDQEWVNGLLEIQSKEPQFHLQPEILHSSSGINGFYDPVTDKDYNGVTVTSLYESPDEYNSGFVTTLTIVFDFENKATQILREYPESTPGGWEISYEPGEAPIKVSEIPAVVERTSSSFVFSN